MSGSAKKASPLVAAAAALDDELRAYDELARDAHRSPIHNEKALQRAIQRVKDAAARNETLQERLQALVTEIEAARGRQVESLNSLVVAAQAVQVRAEQHAALMQRFSALGASAQQVNAMTVELSRRREAGATEIELLGGLKAIQAHMASVVADAEVLSAAAREGEWPDVARQADAVRQQVVSAKNKLLLAQEQIAARAPS